MLVANFIIISTIFGSHFIKWKILTFLYSNKCLKIQIWLTWRWSCWRLKTASVNISGNLFLIICNNNFKVGLWTSLLDNNADKKICTQNRAEVKEEFECVSFRTSSCERKSWFLRWKKKFYMFWYSYEVHMNRIYE